MIKYLAAIFLGAVLLALAFSSPLCAAVVGTTDDAMTVGGGARPIGMGRAFAAISDDCDGMFINPAGLGGLKGPQAMAMYTNLLQEVYYREFSGAVPTTYGTFGLGYITTGINNIPTTPIPSDYYDSLLVGSYSVPLATYFKYGKNVYAGMNYKIFNRGFTGGVSTIESGISADFGVKVVLSPNVSFGLTLQNFLPVSMGGGLRLSSGAEEMLSSIAKVGLAVKPAIWPKLLMLMDADLPMQTGRPATSHIGAEWKENEYLMVRAGMDQSVDPQAPGLTSWNPAFGTSISYGGLRVDYAYHAYYNDPSLATSYVSLSYIGEPWFALKGKVE